MGSQGNLRDVFQLMFWFIFVSLLLEYFGWGMSLWSRRVLDTSLCLPRVFSVVFLEVPPRPSLLPSCAIPFRNPFRLPAFFLELAHLLSPDAPDRLLSLSVTP